MKKLNQTQKKLFKEKIFKLIHIISYVFNGLFLLFLILGLALGTKDKSSYNGTQQPVVSETIKYQPSINYANHVLPKGYYVLDPTKVDLSTPTIQVLISKTYNTGSYYVDNYNIKYYFYEHNFGLDDNTFIYIDKGQNYFELYIDQYDDFILCKELVVYLNTTKFVNDSYYTDYSIYYESYTFTQNFNSTTKVDRVFESYMQSNDNFTIIDLSSIYPNNNVVYNNDYAYVIVENGFYEIVGNGYTGIYDYGSIAIRYSNYTDNLGFTYARKNALVFLDNNNTNERYVINIKTPFISIMHLDNTSNILFKTIDINYSSMEYKKPWSPIIEPEINVNIFDSIYSMLAGVFAVPLSLLGFVIAPGVTIGTIILAPLVFMIILCIINLVRKA